MSSSDLAARPSGCCAARLAVGPHTRRLSTWRCTSCSSLWSTLHARDEQTWAGLALTDEFVDALRERRLTQATEILDLAGRSLGAIGPLLDYGAGQGAFVATAAARGIDAVGCDLDVAPGKVAQVTILPTPGPWAWPDGHWRTVSMLDVIEHHPDPRTLLAEVPADCLIAKVPTARGPLTLAARGAARLGVGGPLEAIFLVDDPSPHLVLFTRRGLASTLRRAGWTVRARAAITEVADELPMRMRLSAGVARPAAVVLGVVGRVLGWIGPWWSDTEVVAAIREHADG